VLVLPERYRKRLCTTNGVERLNEEIRQRDRVIQNYPNRDSALRLITAWPFSSGVYRFETEQLVKGANTVSRGSNV
jgi:transposase-like protein